MLFREISQLDFNVVFFDAKQKHREKDKLRSERENE